MAQKSRGFFAGMLAVAPAAPTSMALLLIMAGSAPTFYLISAEYINRYAGYENLRCPGFCPLLKITMIICTKTGSGQT